MGQLRDLLIEYRESYSKVSVLVDKLEKDILKLCPFYFNEEWTEREVMAYRKYPLWKKDKITEIGLEFKIVNSMARDTDWIIKYLELGHEPDNWKGIPHLRVGEAYREEINGN